MTATTHAAAAAPFDHASTLVVAVEISDRSWVLGAQVPGSTRPCARLAIEPDAAQLAAALAHWPSARRCRRGARSSSTRPGIPGSGSPVCCAPRGSRPTCYIRRACRWIAGRAGRRPTGWTLSSCSAPCWLGCAPNRAWPPVPRPRAALRRRLRARPPSHHPGHGLRRALPRGVRRPTRPMGSAPPAPGARFGRWARLSATAAAP